MEAVSEGVRTPSFFLRYCRKISRLVRLSKEVSRCRGGVVWPNPKNKEGDTKGTTSSPRLTPADHNSLLTSAVSTISNAINFWGCPVATDAGGIWHPYHCPTQPIDVDPADQEVRLTETGTTVSCAPFSGRGGIGRHAGLGTCGASRGGSSPFARTSRNPAPRCFFMVVGSAMKREIYAGYRNEQRRPETRIYRCYS